MAMLTVGNKTNVVSYNTTQSNVFGSGPSAGGVSMLGQLPTPELKQQVAGIHYSAPQGGVQLSTGTDTEKASVAVARGRSRKDLACHHCKVKGHTKKECFQLHGYPDWWDDYQKRKQSDGKARATLVKTNGKETSEEGTISSLYNSFSKNGTWVIDSGATDHMTYSRRDVTSVSKARKSEILDANGVSYPVVGAGDVELTKNLKLSNTLIVPSLSTKLISVGQLAEDMHCVVIMYPNCCVVQDIRTKEIIGHGSKS